jgi:peptide/nickel transport system ATP-binding protein
VAPAHPYTLGLLRSFPDIRGARRELRGVPGSPPDLRTDIRGCPFRPRCDYGFGACADIHPVLRPPAAWAGPGSGAGLGSRAADWEVACHLHDPEQRPDGPPPALSGMPRAETTRAETTSAETTSAETTSAGTTSAETTSAETTSAGTTDADRVGAADTIGGDT